MGGILKCLPFLLYIAWSHHRLQQKNSSSQYLIFCLYTAALSVTSRTKL